MTPHRAAPRIPLLSCCLMAVLLAGSGVAVAREDSGTAWLYSVDELDALFLQHRGSPGGAAVALQLAAGCGLRGRRPCVEALERWSVLRGNHPVVQGALDWVLARQLAVAGRVDRAVSLSSRLGFVERFTVTSPDGDEVVLSAEEVSRWFHVRRFVRLAPREPHRFVTSIQSTSAASLHLRYGGHAPVRICVNQQCTALKGAVKYGFDGVVIAADFEPGANVVLVEWAPEQTQGAFGVRLTTKGGVAVQTAVRDGSLQLVLPGPSSRSGRVRGGRTTSADSGGAEPLAPVQHLLNLGTGQTALLAAAEIRREGRLAAVRAELTEADKLDSPTDRLRWCALILGQPGGTECLQVLLAMEPPDMSALLVSGEFALDGNRLWEASALERRAAAMMSVDSVEQDVRLRHRYLRTDLQLAWGFRARVAYGQDDGVAAAEQGLGGWVVRVAEAALALQDAGRAIEFLGPYLRRWPGDVPVAMLYLHAAATKGDSGAVEETLKGVGWSQELFYPVELWLARLRVLRGDREAARSLLKKVLSTFPGNPELLKLARDLYYGMGDLSDAVEVWLRELRLSPHDAGLWTVGEIMTTGAGSAAGMPVPSGGEDLPGLESVRRAASDMPECRGESYQGVVDHRRVQLFKTGHHVLDRVQAVRVCVVPEDRTVTLEFSYDSYLEDARIIQGVILRADGRVHHSCLFTDGSVSEEEYHLYYDIRRLEVVCEDVVPGDVLFLHYRVQGIPSSLGVPFSGLVWLQDQFPKWGNIVEIRVPDSVRLFTRVETAGYDVVVSEEGTEAAGNRYRLAVDRLPPLRQEQASPGYFETSVHLHFSTTANWETFASWYSKLLEDQVERDPDLLDLVDEAWQQTSDKRELVAWLCRFVADEIRYVGLELGVHGLKPYPPEVVLRRRFGDCKDKSLLLVTLLRLADVRAHVVVVRNFSSGRVHLDPMSPSLFDHALVYIDDLDVFFDPTSKYAGLGTLPWQVQGVQGVVMHPGQERLVELPTSLPSSNVETLHLVLKDPATPNGPYVVEGELRWTGSLLWTWWEALEDPATRKQASQTIAGTVLPGVHVEEAQVEWQTGDAPSLRVMFQGSYATVARQNIPLVPEHPRRRATLTSKSERHFPWVHDVLKTRTVRLEVCARGLRLAQVPPRSGGMSALSFHVEVQTMSNGCQELAVEWSHSQRRIERLEFQRFREAMDEYYRACDSLELKESGLGE